MKYMTIAQFSKKIGMNHDTIKARVIKSGIEPLTIICKSVFYDCEDLKKLSYQARPGVMMDVDLIKDDDDGKIDGYKKETALCFHQFKQRIKDNEIMAAASRIYG